MKSILRLSLLILFISQQSAFGQTNTDLWTVKTSGKGGNLKLETETAKALTDRAEYDNQPSFINEYQLVFSASDEEGNYDIIAYSFNSDKFTNLSKTSDTNEFSPRITDCGMYISAVVMEEDKKQRIWLYPINGEPAELLYDDIEPVEYYDWYNNKAAMFVLGDPNKLIYVSGRNDLLDIDNAVGRSIHKRPNTSEITYLKEDPRSQKNLIRSYDIESGKRKEYHEALENSQDFIWTDKKHLLMASGNEVYIRKYKDNEWKSIGTFPNLTHQNISRMAYSEELEILVVAMERIENN